MNKVLSFFSESEEGKTQVSTETDLVPAYERMKVLLIICEDHDLEVQDKVALYLKACVKVYNKRIKGDEEIEKHWELFRDKFIVAKACEFKVLRDVRIRAQECGYGVFKARFKKDTNPKNEVVAIGLIPENEIDRLLFG